MGVEVIDRVGPQPRGVARGQPGCTLDFLLPWGAEDWLLSVTLFVAGPRILLLESAGPFERFEPVKASLRAAYRTFEPGD